jgi:hypothetical protein
MSKKWASNDKDRLLVENFKKFMEEGDFSADEELNERSWLQMGKDFMKGDFSGDKRRAHRKKRAMYWLRKVADKMEFSSDTIKSAIAQVEEEYAKRLQKDLEELNVEDLDNLLRSEVFRDYQKVRRDHRNWADEMEARRKNRNSRGNKREEARQAAMASGDRRDWAEFKCKWDKECDEWDRMQYDSPTSREDKREKKLGGGYGGDHGGGYGQQHSAPWDE